MKIETPGHYEIPMEVYHSDPAPEPSLSRSTIKDLITRSAAHAWYNSPRLNPDYQPDEGAGKFDVGTASHSILLQGIDNVAVIEADDWRTKAAKEARDEARKNGKTPLLAYQHEKVKKCVQRAEAQLCGCPELGIKNLKEDGDSELSLFWKEESTWCRCRPDFISADRKLLLDIKFTELSVNPISLDRHIINMGYSIQAAFYVRGAKAIFGIEPKFILIFCEIQEPYICSFVGLTPGFMDFGKQQTEFGKFLWEKCLRNNDWPAYENRVHYLEPPAWAITAWEEKSGELGLGK